MIYRPLIGLTPLKKFHRNKLAGDLARAIHGTRASVRARSLSPLLSSARSEMHLVSLFLFFSSSSSYAATRGLAQFVARAPRKRVAQWGRARREELPRAAEREEGKRKEKCVVGDDDDDE